MDAEIIQELIQLERSKPINIVNARERGSRMLGAEHEDSDWDVLFLFSQEGYKYASINGRVDSIHAPHLGENNEIDLHGWNVDKFGNLLKDSNPNAIEYCRADAKEYIRFTPPDAFDDLAKNARNNFNHMSLYYHYISMAKRNWTKYIDSGNDCTLGRQFYVARAIAAAQYIRCEGELPPMHAKKLADEMHEHNDNLAGTLGYLTLAKQRGEGDVEAEDIVGRFYEEESDTPMEPTDERTNSPNTKLIDNFIKMAVVR